MPEGTEFEEIQKEDTPVVEENVAISRELDFQNKMNEVCIDVKNKVEAGDLHNSKIFDILINEPGQRNSIVHVYGEEEITKLEQDLNNLPIDDKDALINQIVERLTPVLKRYFFEPEVIARAQEIAKEEKGESVKAGQIDASIKNSPWEFTLGAGTDGEVKVIVNDKIMELSWPENSRWGLQAIRESLKEVAKLLENKPEIKVVGGVSWMMSHEGANTFGFERFPDLKIENEQREGSLLVAIAGRKDKPYQSDKEPKSTDVIFGAMTRKEFLRKYL